MRAENDEIAGGEKGSLLDLVGLVCLTMPVVAIVMWLCMKLWVVLETRANGSNRPKFDLGAVEPRSGDAARECTPLARVTGLWRKLPRTFVLAILWGGYVLCRFLTGILFPVGLVIVQLALWCEDAGVIFRARAERSRR